MLLSSQTLARKLPAHASHASHAAGCHWNQAAGNALRTTLYDSIMESALLAPGGHALLAPGRHARLAATCPSAGTGARRVSHPDGTLPDGATAAYKKTDGGPPGGTLAPSAAAAGASSASALQRRSGGALRRRRLLGMAACFVASGLVHELIFWCASPSVALSELASRRGSCCSCLCCICGCAAAPQPAAALAATLLKVCSAS